MSSISPTYGQLVELGNLLFAGHEIAVELRRTSLPIFFARKELVNVAQEMAARRKEGLGRGSVVLAAEHVEATTTRCCSR